MGRRPSFSQEIGNLMHATHGSPITACMQCGTCSGTCPAAPFMDHSPRELIAMISADRKAQVLSSNTYWYCASCYYCTVRCPRGINIAGLMYALKRYSMWKNLYKKGLIGPGFSKRFIKMIVKRGKSYEPELAPSFIFKYGVRGLVRDSLTALALFRRGRVSLRAPKIKRIANFRRMLSRIIPMAVAR